MKVFYKSLKGEDMNLYLFQFTQDARHEFSYKIILQIYLQFYLKKIGFHTLTNSQFANRHSGHK